MRILLSALVLVLLTQPALAEDREKLKIFVQPRPEVTESFTHIPQQHINSSKDIVSRLTKRDMKKFFTVVNSAEEADLIVWVDETSEHPISTGSKTTVVFTGNTATVRTRETGWNTKVVRATLIVNGTDYSTDVSGGSSDWMWTSAAWSVAYNVRDWTKQNDGRLRDRASQRDR